MTAISISVRFVVAFIVILLVSYVRSLVYIFQKHFDSVILSRKVQISEKEPPFLLLCGNP